VSIYDAGKKPDSINTLQREIEELKKQLEHHEHIEKMHHDSIAEVSKAIYRLDSFENTAKVIFQACKRATGARSGYVAMLSPDGTENSVLYLDAGGMPCTVDPNLPMPIRGLRAEAYKSKRPAFDNEFKDSKWWKFMPQGHVMLKNVIFAPMVIGEEAKGLIGLANKPGGFSNEDAEIAMSYAEIGAIALQSSEMIEKIRKSNDMLQDAYQDAHFLKDLLVHDINNVFQAISGVTMLWQLKIKKSLSITGQLDSLGVIAENVARGANLIQTIQKLERLVDPNLGRKDQDLVMVLKESISLLKARFPSKQVNVDIESSEESVHVNTSELIRDVFENILINAVKHNDKEKVEIKIVIKKEIKDGNTEILLEFIDNGNGIEDARKQSIFDRVITRAREKDGLGIGLSVVKRIITRCGGKVWVEDAVKGESERGSKFIITLPLGSTELVS
jgi:signal transduction histidine kinase